MPFRKNKVRAKSKKSKTAFLRKVLQVPLTFGTIVTTKTARIQYSSVRQTRLVLREFCVYLVFVMLTTIVTQSTSHLTMYHANDLPNRMLAKRVTYITFTTYTEFQSISNIDGFWKFIKFTFLKMFVYGDFKKTDRAALFANYTQTPESFGETFELIRNRTVLHGNILFGPPRLRQIRVRAEPCPNIRAFSQQKKVCYGPYSWFNEDRTTHMGQPWQSRSETGSTIIMWGDVDVYFGAGYVVDLTYDGDKNHRRIDELEAKGWINRATRAVILEYSVYHVNTRLLQSAKFMLEQVSSGGVSVSSHFRVLCRNSFLNDPNWYMSACVCGFYILIGCQTYTDLRLICREGFRAYIGYIVNLMDCAICLIAYAMLLYQVFHWLYVEDLMLQMRTHVHYVSTDWACFWNVHYANMAAVLVFLVWMRLLHFIGFNRTMIIFVNVMRECANDVFEFLFMFMVIVLAYAQFGMLMFSTKHRYFRNFRSSLLTMVRWILCDVDYAGVQRAHKLLGPLFCFSFIVTVLVILLHIFLAIINATYDTVKRDLRTRPEKLSTVLRQYWYTIFDFLYHLFTRKRRKRQRIDELDADEDEYEMDERINPHEAVKAAIARKLAELNVPLVPPRIYMPERVRRASTHFSLCEEVMGELRQRLQLLERLLIAEKTQKDKAQTTPKGKST